MNLHHLSSEDRALLRAAAERAEARRRDEEGRGAVAWVFFTVLTAVLLAVAILARGGL